MFVIKEQKDVLNKLTNWLIKLNADKITLLYPDKKQFVILEKPDIENTITKSENMSFDLLNKTGKSRINLEESFDLKEKPAEIGRFF